MNYDYEEYNQIVSPILANEDVKELENIRHHNSNRLEHSKRVSYYSYIISKRLHLDYVGCARAGLLHDFFLERTVQYKNPKDKFLLFTTKHPMYALENAKNHFPISEKEADIIRTHMFPVDYHVPKYAESWIVSGVDKVVSTFEFSRKFHYQLSYVFNLFFILLFNSMK